MRYTAIILGALGDFLLTLPLLCALRKRGALTVITRGAYRAVFPPVLRDAGFFDLNSAAMACLFADSCTPSGLLKEALRDAEVHAFMRPDEAVSQQVQRAAARGLLWHDPRPQSPPHIATRFFERAGIDPPPRLLDTPVMPRQHSGRGLLWAHAGSGSPAKTIPSAHFAGILAHHVADHDGLVVSFGEADLALREPVIQALRQAGLQAEIMVCESLCQLRAGLATNAALFIGADSGPTHLAAALGIPTIAVFRTTDPRIWRPLGRVAVEICPGGRNRPSA